ncbi:LacI family DNA-binding transcriptional regulator [Rathayibacter sp. VKM Ac-2856]|uniref:LacI family DNA-binding transcriptional regulator n=1 Tax=unclassified Rathayibacter TaxID=2609250 RepID=UPI001563891D|nr:LacI family DNA-binding transcriptional regulator [Rathayibacter sp. VKM Ac-2858]NQX18538.1 LacI family DNA-binding transcriptional regulator [Rathayibacter sp. VKM Ac-2856]
MAKQRVTLADVAREAGLSISAASMILNGKPETGLSKDAHERVFAAAEALRYRPNVAARGLRTDKTRTIGFISDAIATTRFAGGLVKGALTAAEKAGHVILLLETGGDPAREAEAVDAVLDRQVDGIIFASVRSREFYVPDLPATTSVVMLNATNSHHPVSVLPDEYAGGRAAVELLADAGHREGIVLIGQNDEVERDRFRSATIAQRVAGIRDAMAERGLTFVSEESIAEWEPEFGFRAVTALLERNPEVRALLCLNDRLAFGAHQALTEAGLSVPGDVSIVSFDNDELAAYLRPGLTTIALPHEEMGRRAVELLLAAPAGAAELVPMPVVVRASIAGARRR